MAQQQLYEIDHADFICNGLLYTENKYTFRIVLTGERVITIEFRKMGENTIKCVISEKEVQEMGFSVEEIITNGNRTQEFMNHIFDMAEQEFQMKFDLGIKTVKVEFRSDRSLTLTFSSYPAEDMLENLKELISGIFSSISPERLAELADMAEQAAQESENNTDFVLILQFTELEEVIRFAKRMSGVSTAQTKLIKYHEIYYLTIDFSGEKEEDIHNVALMANEYGLEMETGRERAAYIEEHGKVLIGDYAVEGLMTL